jgi:hypothetical protein
MLSRLDHLRASRFDQAPARGELMIIWRQLPACVQMLGQNDDGVDLSN